MKASGYILKSNKEWFIKQIKRLNKKAIRLDCEPIIITFTGNTKLVPHPENDIMLISYEEVVIEGKSPCIEGWELVAVFQRQSSDIFVRTLPDKMIPKKYFQKDSIECEHCGFNRNRKKSFLLLKDNEYKEVGSTCVKNFFEVDIKAFMFQASIDFYDIIDSGATHNYMNLPIEIDLLRYIEMAARCIDEYGWTSITKAKNEGGIPTINHIDFQLFTIKKPEEILYPTEKNKKEAVKVIEYFKNVDEEDNSYLIQCKKIANAGYVPEKFGGFAASMVYSYRKHIEREMKIKNSTCEWIGEVGKRINLDEVIVNYENSFQGRWGIVHLYKFDYNGNYITWFASREQDVEVGDKVKFVGTVKKHDIYKDEKSTLCTRCKLSKI